MNANGEPPKHGQQLNPRNLPIIGQTEGVSKIPIIRAEADPKLVQAQKEMVAEIKAQAAQQQEEREAQELAEKIVPLSGADLEKQRKAAVAIDGMIIKRLENGAIALEKMVCAELRQGPAADVPKAHVMMEQAKSLRIAMGFIQNG